MTGNLKKTKRKLPKHILKADQHNKKESNVGRCEGEGSGATIDLEKSINI